MTSSLPPLIQACSGALASASANAISYPLDLVATRVQTTRNPHLHGERKGAMRILRHILRTQGLSGLYEGLGADTASTVVSNFLYFYFYTLLHAIVARRRAHSSAPLLTALKRALTAPTPPVPLGISAELAVGFVAGVASRAVSTPLSVITIRLQSGDEDDDEDSTAAATEHNESGKREAGVPSPVKTRESLMDVVRSVYAEQGFRGFWAGFAPTLPLALTPALTLLLYQLLRQLRLPSVSSVRRPAYAAVRTFIDGACANALALALLYPLILAKVRVQAWHSDPDAPTMLDIWRVAHATRGWAGLYDGLGTQLVKGFVSQGVTMMVKQRQVLL
ncbi:mitochondrial carrier [Laetiporus sulphureus 93-53]|uniref:Mitochondrial carrier n=1 Tax=Laetiporus sulphureus 93-53 TaxID=1314785 RepID=A0A165D1C5_9APHY|nr:mitochondrial carrier [Laetiporus sulphureus 93-53]KZT03946.1 mitochondrial carrier [Laetiporus sulphureus 93-53]